MSSNLAKESYKPRGNTSSSLEHVLPLRDVYINKTCIFSCIECTRVVWGVVLTRQSGIVEGRRE